MANPVEVWKSEKHGFDVWPDVERHAAAGTPMKQIDSTDLERMKWHGYFYRKRDEPGRYMNRIRITAGELSSAQAKEIARLAYEFGHGIIDVTTRANLQVQGLAIEHLPLVTQRLTSVGLTSKQTGHDNIRNVFAHPFSGLLPDEIIDTRTLCHEITELFLDSREYADLPRKMNICLNGTADHSAHFWTQDISYLATRGRSDEVRFHLLVGGTQGQNPHLAWHLPVLVRPEQVVDTTRAILDLFRVRGSREKRNAARFRFLVEELRPAGVLHEIEQRLGYSLDAHAEQPRPATSYDELIGWFRQAERDRWTMGLCVPLGRLTWRQLEGLGVLAARWGSGSLRTTHEQGIAVVDIPDAHRAAAVTDAAALGLSIHADSLDRNTMACTGSQFCNIAVTETKGQMFQLLDKLRKKQVRLEGIRIHMSGCPSSCAQHFTADIGLKGVRVRRLLGTREGFDVFLGGGVGGDVQMGRLYRLGVDADQLPTLIEEVVTEYYLRHSPGQTFSAYWREQLPAACDEKAGDDDYLPPVWVCDRCQHRHAGVDPPIFCPSCAALRRFFARLDDASPSATTMDDASAQPASAAPRNDGFSFAARLDDIPLDSGLAVEIGGQELALFRVEGKVTALDAACPHEGAPLVQGELKDGVVTCPWHGWTFNACTGCSLEPADQNLGRYETLIEEGQVFVKLAAAPVGGPSRPTRRATASSEAVLSLLEIVDEAPDVRTFRFDNRAGQLQLDYPGKFARIAVPVGERDVWRSFTISSSPTTPEYLDLTIKLNRTGVASRYLFDEARPGSQFKLRGPQGGFLFDPARHDGPLVLVSAGSGVTPMISIARYLREQKLTLPCTFLHGARMACDVLFRDECQQLAVDRADFNYQVTLSQPEADWEGHRGRIDVEFIERFVPQLAAGRYYLCGPNGLIGSLTAGLVAAGVPGERIHSELFHAKAPVTA